MVGGGCEVLGQLAPIGAKSPILNRHFVHSALAVTPGEKKLN